MVVAKCLPWFLIGCLSLDRHNLNVSLVMCMLNFSFALFMIFRFGFYNMSATFFWADYPLITISWFSALMMYLLKYIIRLIPVLYSLHFFNAYVYIPLTVSPEVIRFFSFKQIYFYPNHFLFCSHSLTHSKTGNYCNHMFIEITLYDIVKKKTLSAPAYACCAK